MASPKSIGTIPELLTVVGRGVHRANENMEILDLHTLVHSKGKDLVPRVMAFSGGKVRIHARASVDESSKEVSLFGLGDSEESDRSDLFEVDLELDLVVLKPTDKQMELVDRLSGDEIDEIVAKKKLEAAASDVADRFDINR